MNRIWEIRNTRFLAVRSLQFHAPFAITALTQFDLFPLFLPLLPPPSVNLNIRSFSLSPPSYSPHYIIFSPSEKMAAAADPIPSVVGALSCQKDSYLQTLKTEVVSCIEYVPPPTNNVKQKSKKPKDAEQVNGNGNGTSTPDKTWLIELADSVLFPEGTSLKSHMYMYKGKCS